MAAIAEGPLVPPPSFACARKEGGRNGAQEGKKMEGKLSWEEDGILRLQEEILKARSLMNSHAMFLRRVSGRISELKASLVDVYNTENLVARPDSDRTHFLSSSLGSSPNTPPKFRFNRSSTLYPPPLLNTENHIMNSLYVAESYGSQSEAYKKLIGALRAVPTVIGPALKMRVDRKNTGAEEIAKAIVGEICGYCPVPGYPCRTGEKCVLSVLSSVPFALPPLSGIPGDDRVCTAVLREFCRRCGGDYLRVTLGPLLHNLMYRESTSSSTHASNDSCTSGRHLLPVLSRLIQSLLRSLPGVPNGILTLAEIVEGSRPKKECKSPPRPPIIAVHSSKLRRKPAEGRYQSPEIITRGLPSPWGFVLGELIPYALRNASSLHISQHHPVTASSSEDLEKLARLMEDICVGQEKWIESKVRQAAFSSLLPPMRMSILHYIKAMDYPEELSNRIPGVKSMHSDPPTTPIVISSKETRRLHEMLFRCYHRPDSSRMFPGLPLIVAQALEACSHTDGTGEDFSLAKQGRAHTFPKYASSFDLKTSHSPLSDSDDNTASSSGVAPEARSPPIVALIPCISNLILPPLKLKKSLIRRGIPEQVSSSVDSLIRVVCALPSFKGRNIPEIVQVLRAEGSFGEGVALEGALVRLQASLEYQASNKKPEKFWKIPEWLLGQIIEIYESWRCEVESEIRQTASLEARIADEMAFSEARKAAALTQLTETSARNPVFACRGAAIYLVQALDEIACHSCASQFADADSEAEIVGDRGSRESQDSEDRGSSVLRSSFEPITMEVTGEDEFACLECRKRMQKMKQIFRDSQDIKRSAMVGSIHSSMSEIGTYVQDALVAEVAESVFTGCATREKKFSELLLHLHDTHQTSLSSLYSLLRAVSTKDSKCKICESCNSSPEKKSKRASTCTPKMTLKVDSETLRIMQLEISKLCESSSILTKMEAIRNFDSIFKVLIRADFVSGDGANPEFYAALLGTSILSASPREFLGQLVGLQYTYPEQETVPEFVRFQSAVRDLFNIRSLIRIKSPPDESTHSRMKKAR